MFCVVWDYTNSKLKDNQYKQKTPLKSYKTGITIFANPGLPYLGFEQPGPGAYIYWEFFFLSNTLGFFWCVQWIGGYFRKCTFGVQSEYSEIRVGMGGGKYKKDGGARRKFWKEPQNRLFSP